VKKVSHNLLQDIPQKERDRIVDAFSAIPSVYHVSNEDMKNALEKADEELQEFKKEFESHWKENSKCQDILTQKN
jgi:hypothetical protein